MNEVLMIGIDGLDPILLSKFADQLPNFRNLREEGTCLECQSVFPYDSIPIWSSIYTGLTPASHGILKSHDIDVKSFSGRTFWDYASRSGKKVCVINPFLAYPPWEVNGVMVSGPVKKIGGPHAIPEDILDKYEIPHLGGIHERYPLKSELTKYYEYAKKITLDEAKFSLRLLKDYEWNFAFSCFITLDGIEHFFWRYYDDDDPTHPDNNPFKNSILDFYILFDKILGEFSALDPDVLIVLSDHGHGIRSTKLVNVNEALRQKGLLTSNVKKTKMYSNILEHIKLKLLDSIYQYDLDNLALELARYMPKMSKNIQKSEFSVDMNHSEAYTTDLVGMNPCGGINIVKENIKHKLYDEVSDFIISEISELKDPKTGEIVVEWVCKRDDLYSGEYISSYPDIIFKLKERYGVNWSIYTPVICNCYAHKIISGGHKKEATFIISGKVEANIHRNRITSIDVAPTILDILSINNTFNFDGKSIFKRE
jgi:predicted AlkP superfamily phosphohydrolase/phosphomutase